MEFTKYTTNKLYWLLMLIPVLLLVGCNKDFATPPPTASIRVANTISSIPKFYTSFNGTESLAFYSSVHIEYGLSNRESNYINRTPGLNQFAFYRPTDTSHPEKPYYRLNVNLEPNSYYSLFLTGTENNPDTLLLKETFNIISDSSTGIRVIHLSPGSAPISVNIQGMPIGSLVPELSYKDYSAFFLLAAHSSINNYTFEFRDKFSGTVLTTYTTSKINQYVPTGTGYFRNLWLFRNATLMVTGIPGGTGNTALRVELINHI